MSRSTGRTSVILLEVNVKLFHEGHLVTQQVMWCCHVGFDAVGLSTQTFPHIVYMCSQSSDVAIPCFIENLMAPESLVVIGGWTKGFVGSSSLYNFRLDKDILGTTFLEELADCINEVWFNVKWTHHWNQILEQIISSRCFITKADLSIYLFIYLFIIYLLSVYKIPAGSISWKRWRSGP